MKEKLLSQIILAYKIIEEDLKWEYKSNDKWHQRTSKDPAVILYYIYSNHEIRIKQLSLPEGEQWDNPENASTPPVWI